MSVILTLAAIAITQGFSQNNYTCNITNSGDENVREIKLKVTDSVVYSELKVNCIPSTKINCLNVFSTQPLREGNTVNKLVLPAGQTKSVQFGTFVVNAGAPVQVHNLTCDFQYEVY